MEAAKTQLATAQDQFPELECDLIPVGLGSAYKLSCTGKAILVPSVAALLAAGAPEGTEPLGQELPMFACMEITRAGEEGPLVPLFMSYVDYSEAVARETDAYAPEQPLQMVCLSLASVVEELAGLDDPSSGAFSFVAPSESLQHIETYLGKGVYWREVPSED